MKPFDASREIDVFGVGNALVDILAQVDDEFLTSNELDKGGMMLVDPARQTALLDKLSDQSLQKKSGGSAANTMIAIAQSGGTGFYTGKVFSDDNGNFYKQDMIDSKIGFDVPPATDGDPTGTCVVLTTPDAERTMCTNLGISTTLTKNDINVDQLKRCKYSYIEGYLWDADDPRAACIETFEQSKKHGVIASFTFSDAFLIGRFDDEFKNVINEYCDVVFCNADEVRQFFGEDDLQKCIGELGKMVELGFVTDGANGSFIVDSGNIEAVAGFQANAVDSVGAGDAFAGGALYALTHGHSPAKAAAWGNYFASRVVEIFGPRLDAGLAAKVDEILMA